MEHLCVCVCVCVSSVRGTWRRAPLQGTVKDMLGKALETGVCFHRNPFWGTWLVQSFARDFERSVKFFCQKNFY